MATSSKRKHLAAGFLGFWECLLYGGLKYGWASLVFVLKDLGYFFSDCSGDGDRNPIGNHSILMTSDTVITHFDQQIHLNLSQVFSGINGSQVHRSCDTFLFCTNQDSCLHLVFTVSTVACGIIVIPAGVLVDKLNIRVPRLTFR